MVILSEQDLWEATAALLEKRGYPDGPVKVRMAFRLEGEVAVFYAEVRLDEGVQPYLLDDQAKVAWANRYLDPEQHASPWKLGDHCPYRPCEVVDTASSGGV